MKNFTKEEMLKAVEYISFNPCASFWIKDAYKKLNDRDPVDALHDVELLYKILEAKLNLLQKANYDQFPQLKNG